MTAYVRVSYDHEGTDTGYTDGRVTFQDFADMLRPFLLVPTEDIERIIQEALKAGQGESAC